MPLSLIWACISGLLFALNDQFSHIQSQTVKSNHKHQLTLLLYMNNAIETDEIDTNDYSEEWTNIMNRGGLYQVSRAIYHLP